MMSSFTEFNSAGCFTVLVFVAGQLFAGLGAKVFEKAFESRFAVILSSVLMGVGLLLVPLATSPFHIAATLVLLFGPGCGILFTLGKALVGRHFRDHFDLACGIGHAGNAVAFLVLAPLTQLFLDTYGWRVTTLLLACICMQSVAFSALVRDATPQYDSLPDNSDTTEHEHGDTSTKSCCFRMYKAFDLHILIEFNFFILFMGYAAITFSYYSWMVYFVPHLLTKGFRVPQLVAALCTVSAYGYLLGSIILGPLIDRGLVKCAIAMVITSLQLLTLSSFVNPWVNDVCGMAVILFLFGFSVAAYYTLLDILTKELFTPCRLTSAVGWCRAGSALPAILFVLLPGWVYDTVGSYDVIFIGLGIAPTLSLLPIIVAILQKE